MRGLTLRFVLLTGMAIGLVGISAVIQELQAASTAWIMGQSHWSRAQQQAVASLHRYLESGHAADLQQARTQLDVPLADLQARQALERQPPDTNAARAAFLRGRGRHGGPGHGGQRDEKMALEHATPCGTRTGDARECARPA